MNLNEGHSLSVHEECQEVLKRTNQACTKRTKLSCSKFNFIRYLSKHAPQVLVHFFAKQPVGIVEDQLPKESLIEVKDDTVLSKSYSISGTLYLTFSLLPTATNDIKTLIQVRNFQDLPQDLKCGQVLASERLL